MLGGSCPDLGSTLRNWKGAFKSGKDPLMCRQLCMNHTRGHDLTSHSMEGAPNTPPPSTRVELVTTDDKAISLRLSGNRESLEYASYI